MSSRTPPPADPSARPGGQANPGEAAASAVPHHPPHSRSLGTRVLGVGRVCLRAVPAALRHPVCKGTARALLRVTAGLAVLAVFAMLLVRFALWPHAAVARGWLEERASAALSARFTVGRLETGWDGWHPTFHAVDIRAVDPQGRVLLAAGTIDGALSWSSLTRLDLQFARFSATRTDLLVRRTPQGKLMIAGLPMDPSAAQPQDDRFLDWLLAQGRVELADGAVRWLDEKAGLPLLEVADIHLVAQRDGARHTLRLEARSATLSPQPLVVQADFRHDYLRNAGNWRNWHGQASWNLSRVELPTVQRYLAMFTRAGGGTLSTDGTIEFGDGHVARSQARLRGTGIDVQLAGASEPLRLANAQALLLHRTDRNGEHQLTIDTLLWQAGPGDGTPATAGDTTAHDGMRKVVVGWAADGHGQLRKFSLKAPTFDLNAVSALAASMPLESATARRLRALHPAGHIDNLDVAWNRDPGTLLSRKPGPQHYKVQGILREVSVREQQADPAPSPDGHPPIGTPGFTRLSGNFAFDDRQGSARFEGNGATVTLPGLFDEPRLNFDQLNGAVSWRHDNGALVISTEGSDGIRFANADTAGAVRGNWRAGGDGKGGIADLSGELSRANVSRVPRYLPLGVPAGTRHYLAGALVAGDAHDVRFVLKGDLAHFPFRAPHEHAGDFRVAVPIRQVTYQIAPELTEVGGRPAWPPFTDIMGEVLFERGGMSFLAQRATVQGIGGVMLRDVGGRIAELGPHGHLLIDGTAAGPTQGFLRYIAASPVRDWTGQVTTEARAQGNGELRLKLDLPLDDTRLAKVQGRFGLPGNDIVLSPKFPLLAGASGAIAFDEHGFQLENLRAGFLGGDIRASGGTLPDGAIRVTASGTATAQGLAGAAPGTAVAALGRQLEGSTAYSAVLAVRDRQPQVTVNTDLNGMAIKLPEPLTKPAAQSVPVRFELRPTAGKTATQEILLQYGGLLNARYLLRSGPDGIAVQAGGIGVQQPAPTPASGVTAALTLERFDLDAWRAALADLGATGRQRAADAATGSLEDSGNGGGNGGGSGGKDEPAGYLPERIVARSRTLRAFGRDLDDVSLDATRATEQEGGGWRFRLDSRQVAGEIGWRDDTANPSGAMTLRLSRLNIPDTTEEGHMVDALASKISELPAIDLAADHFELRGHDFGRLEVKAHTTHAEGEPVWRLERLMIEQPGATLTGSGNWRVPRRLREQAATDRRTVLDFALEIRNAGEVLDRMGMSHMLRDGHGKLEGRVAWVGSPLSIDYPSLSGQVNLKLQNGQILAVEPGAAKLLGVLSLQGLLRLATFDFRGIAGDGVAFDDVSGTGTIENGIGSTRDFRLKGAQVTATMTGSANLPRETQDLEVALVPRISVTSASVAAAFINPALGIGTLAAQLLFADEFSKAFTQHYRVSGSWASPQVTKVGENKADAIRKIPERLFLQ